MITVRIVLEATSKLLFARSNRLILNGLKVVLKLALVTLLLVQVDAALAQEQKGSCRSLEKLIWYTEPPLDAGVSAYDCDVVNVLAGGTAPTITIRCPSGVPSSGYWGFEKFKAMTSKTYGQDWRVVDFLGEQIPFAAVMMPDRELFQAAADSRILYRRIQDIGLYLRSEDGGKTWLLPQHAIFGQSKEQFLSRFGANRFYTTDFHLLAIDPKLAKHVYARVILRAWAGLVWIPGPLPDIEVPAIYESLDGGENWREAPGIPSQTKVLGLSLTSPKLFYAYAHNTLLKSDDEVHWAAVGQNNLIMKQPMRTIDQDPEVRKSAPRIDIEITQIIVDPSDSQIVFFISNKGLYRSIDGAKTWCILDLGFDQLRSVSSMVLNPANPQELYVGTSNGIFQSRDRGSHFERIYPRAH